MAAARKKRNELCWYFNTKRGCKNGARCKYLHVPDAGSGPLSQETCTNIRRSSSVSSDAVRKARKPPWTPISTINRKIITPIWSGKASTVEDMSDLEDLQCNILSMGSPPRREYEDSHIQHTESLSQPLSQEPAAEVHVSASGCKCRLLTIVIPLCFAILLAWLLVSVPILSWNFKALRLFGKVESEIASLYQGSKNSLSYWGSSMYESSVSTANAVVEGSMYTANGVVRNVATIFEKSGKFAFKINNEVQEYFEDVTIHSYRDTWITRVSEGIALNKGLEYLENKRSQPDRYPKQFVDDLESVIVDMLNANVKSDFLEYKEVAFENFQLRGHVGVIAVRRYAYKNEFDIAFSITSTDVRLEAKSCYRGYLGLGKCEVDMTSRTVRAKLIKYFQRELILDLKNDYPGQIEIINSEDS